MRDAVHVQKFRERSPALNADNIITASAAREVVAQKALRQTSAPKAATPATSAASNRIAQSRRVTSLQESEGSRAS